MSRVKGIASAVLAALAIALAVPAIGQAQDVQRPRRSSSSYDRAYQLGFDVGYRTGFDKGVEDRRGGRSRNSTDYKEYRRGDDGFNDRVGNREEYRLGYRAGFDKGYTDGLADRQFGARPGAQGRVAIPRGGNGPVLQRGGGYPAGGPVGRGGYYGGRGDNYGYGGRRVGFDSTMVVELETPITTRHSQEGDRFSAIVVEPSSYYGSRVEGYIGKLDRPGRVSGKGEIVLVFTDIVFPDGYAEPMQAQVEEVIGYPRGIPRPGSRGPSISRAPWEWGKNDDRNDDVDAEAGDEGQIEGKGSRGRDAAVVGGGAAVGAAIGSVIGGGSGAAVGAAIGAATGGGIVATTRGHEIDLEPGAQLRIRTGQGVRP